MSHSKFFTRDALIPTFRHCEAQFMVYLEANQFRDAVSPKQSHGSEFETKSEQEDCFVTSTLQNSMNINTLQMYSKNIPRNDTLLSKTKFALGQTEFFGMTHV